MCLLHKIKIDVISPRLLTPEITLGMEHFFQTPPLQLKKKSPKDISNLLIPLNEHQVTPQISTKIHTNVINSIYYFVLNCQGSHI